ncbi:MAG: DJ-1/PfpI family protein [Candidatus Pacebacteria bacterium]|nr:DJ-1/PfpI family protein [Candidatus Paceibacterota bacterium]
MTKKFLIPTVIIVLVILVGFAVYRTVLNYRGLVGKENPAQGTSEGTSTATSTENQNGESPTINLTPALEDKSILMVVPYNDFNEEEYIDLRQIFVLSGGDMKLASTQGGAAISDKENVLPLDFSIEDVNLADFDAIVFIGGLNTALMENLNLPSAAKAAIWQGKTIALIQGEVVAAGDFSNVGEFGMRVVEVLTNL